MTAPASRPAATLLLVRDGTEGLEVFMMMRHRQMDFAPGALVFPGGGLEPGDEALARDEALCAPTPGLDLPARAFRVGALRETFEECGLLLARDRNGGAVSDARAKAAAARLADGDLASILAAEKLSLALDALVPFAHWITPQIMPKRFDTHFYIVAAPEGQAARVNESESSDAVWINPLRALREAEGGRFPIILPTRLNLALLGQSNRVAEALEAARTRRIVTVQPEATKVEGGYQLRIPLEAGYGGEVFML